MNRLPPEILMDIGDRILEEPHPEVPLLALTLTCRKFRSVFLGMMYKRINTENFTLRFVKMIMKLWRDPVLAGKVRRLELSWTRESEDQFDLGDSRELRVFINHAVNKIFTPEENDDKYEWTRQLKRGHLRTEAWIGLLLVRATNVEIIEFVHECGEELMPDILRKAAKREKPFHKSPPFPYLKEVKRYAQEEYRLKSDFLTPLFYFPAVRKIYGSEIIELKEEDGDRGPLGISQSSCPVEEIQIDDACWSQGMLDWLKICTKLERLSIKFEEPEDYFDDSDDSGDSGDDSDDSDDDNECFDASAYRTALLPFRETLKTLRISYGPRYISCLIRFNVNDPPFGTFQDFTALERLTVEHTHLCGRSFVLAQDNSRAKHLSRLLPKSLKTLEIRNIMEAPPLLSQLSELFDSGYFQNLEQLSLHTPFLPYLTWLTHGPVDNALHPAFAPYITRAFNGEIHGLLKDLMYRCATRGVRLQFGTYRSS
ncbi:hypothetical protein N7456_010368 [Penicillium angulare]|uniref:Leucine-rich repeat domain-containing protein n=1 Tax=Penicillium angulare TaxID=116970 RepID=A0A9W9F6M4_9EURO|nr:hypothetical protein N7456_010368 [Penicillium angulare]